MTFRKKSENLQLNIFNGLLFLAFPFLAIPGILRSLYKNTFYGTIFYSLLVSFISYLFQPSLEMDKARHMYFYDVCKNLSLYNFFEINFQDSPDFIFRLALYLGANWGVNVHYVFFFVTFGTVFMVFRVYQLYLDKLGKKNSYLITLLLILSLSYIDILSGMRYTLAASFILLGFYKGIIDKKRISILYLLLGVFTHFATLIFAIIFISFPLLIRIRFKSLRIALVVSVLFLLVPQEVLLAVFKTVGLGGAFELKVNAYIDVDTSVTTQLSFSQKFIEFFNILWIYLLNLHFISKKDNISQIGKLLIILLIFTNIFISLPIIYNRYALFIKLIFVFWIINSDYGMKKYLISKVLIVIFSIICVNQIIILRPSLINIFTPSLSGWNFIYQMFENKFNINDLK